MFQRRSGFTMIEVALAIAVGLAVIAGAVVAYNGMQTSAKFSQAKTMVGTIQTNIGMQKFRKSTPPTAEEVASNEDSTGKPFWPGTDPGDFPDDPITLSDAIATYDSTEDATALVPADIGKTEYYDNPIFQDAGMGKGGWLYDETTGTFRVNLSNKDYPEHQPSRW